MHSIIFQPENTKDNKQQTHGNQYRSMMILHENDLKNDCICLRGFVVDCIFIPRTYSLSENPYTRRLLEISLTPKIGVIKIY